MNSSDRYIINNQEFNLFNLKVFCNKILCLTSHDWERDIYDFILAFLNDDEEIEVQTSGSTGVPKLIRVQKSKMVRSAQMTASYFQLNKDDKVLLCLPATYIAGKMMIVRALVNGLNLIIRKPNMDPLSKLLGTDNIAFAAMVPAQLIGKDLSVLKCIDQLIVGGAAVSSDLKALLSKSDCRVYETYGMTETLSHVAVREIGVDQCFHALEGVLFSQDDRSCLKVDANGLLDEALQTNDIVDLISPTEFEWLGRFDNVVNSGGVKLMPEAIELKLAEVFKELLFTNRYFISGMPCDELGEKLVLIIEGESLNVSALKEEMSAVLDRFEVPKEVFFVDHFEETSSAKVHRKNTLLKLK